MSLKSIVYENGKLEILDQLLLPNVTKYVRIDGVQDGWRAINSMQVRGAPAIAIVGCLSLAIELQKELFNSKKVIRQEVEGKLNYLVSARPTAVNMKIAAQVLINFVNELDENETVGPEDMKRGFISAIEAMLEKDIADNRAIGEFGADAILSSIPEDHVVRILTHCNTGSLATAGHGTALGIIRTLHARKRIEHVYCTETRPYNQGARLTAYELVHERIPSTLVCDSMVAALMKSRSILAVVVGADRVAANGDTANKIGTYQIAVTAKYHKVPFYVAAPFTSIDFSIPSGEYIVIEERPDKEMTHIGEHRIAAQGISCWNPAFDVTPTDLITAIITERGSLNRMSYRTSSSFTDHQHSRLVSIYSWGITCLICIATLFLVIQTKHLAFCKLFSQLVNFFKDFNLYVVLQHSGRFWHSYLCSSHKCPSNDSDFVKI